MMMKNVASKSNLALGHIVFIEWFGISEFSGESTFVYGEFCLQISV